MDRYWKSNTAANAPITPDTNAGGFPQDEMQSSDVKGTVPGAWWYHSVTEEIRNAITTLGGVPDWTKTDQLGVVIAGALDKAAQTLGGSDGAAQIGFVQSGSAMPRDMQAKAREVVSVLDYGAKTGGDTANGLTNRKAFQTAITALWRAGGGEIVIPRGTYALDVAVPIIVPSGIGIRGEPGSWIVPNIATVVDVATRPFPLANGAVFVTGNPDTGQRAAIENGTGVTEVSFSGVQIRCDYLHGSLSAGQQLRGLGAYAVDGLRVSGCVVLNLPNSGIVAGDCSEAMITGNRANGSYGRNWCSGRGGDLEAVEV